MDRDNQDPGSSSEGRQRSSEPNEKGTSPDQRRRDESVARGELASNHRLAELLYSISYCASRCAVLQTLSSYVCFRSIKLCIKSIKLCIQYNVM